MAARDAVIAALGRIPGVDVLVDTKMRPNDEWFPAIHEWLAECHAAVVVIGPAALGSRWVLKEATILAWRRSRDEAFKLFTTFVGGVDDAQLAATAAFAPLDVGRWQRLRFADLDGGLAAGITGLAAAPAGATPLDQVAELASRLLDCVTPGRLDELAAALGVVPPSWRPEIARTRQLGDLIARRLVSGGLPNFADAVTAMHGLMKRSDAMRLLELVTPFWVEPMAAASVALRHRRSRRILVMNGRLLRDFTARMYVRRAFLGRQQGDVAALRGASDTRAEEQIRDELRELVRGLRGPDNELPYADAEDEAIDVLLQSPRTSLFVFTPFIPDEAIASWLRVTFPGICFICTDRKGVAPPPEGRRSDLDYVEPDLDLAAEQAAFEAYDAARAAVRNMP